MPNVITTVPSTCASLAEPQTAPANPSIKIPQHVLDEHRYFNIYDYWYEPILMQASEDAKGYGWEVDIDNINFTGFYSQGDGASFTGECWSAQEVTLFLDTLAGEYPYTRLLLSREGHVSFMLERTDSRYYHENTVKLYIEADEFLRFMDQRTVSPLRLQAAEALDALLNEELKVLEVDAIDFLRRKMREVYGNLEEEHDYLTSDEQVTEAILDNDLYDPTEEEED